LPPATKEAAMGSRQASRLAVMVIAALTIAFPSAAAGKRHPHGPAVTELATFAAPGCTGTCGSGSTIGPDGALYVTDGQTGRVLRVDTRSGAVTTFAAGLPLMNTPPGIGGAIDVAFVGPTAYVLVANVGAFFGDPGEIAGIYRVRRNGSAVPMADIGAWAEDNPPDTEFVLPGGVQYAIEPYLGGFAVTDGHHNRVIYVRYDGRVRELLAVGNVVPTGLAAAGLTLFMGQAGAVPHLPRDGKVVAITPWSKAPVKIASGAPLVVDVEFGPDRRLYALAQGIWTLPPLPENAGAPASANTGTLTRVDHHGRLTPVAGPLDRPTSVAFSRRSAFVVTLTGKVLRIDGRW
jgi:sugar lactone lactonase YvrE